MHIGLILRGGVEEGTEDRNPFPVFVELIRRLVTGNKVHVFSFHGEKRIHAIPFPRREAPPFRFAGAEVFQLGTAGMPRFRLAADLLRLLATIHFGGPRWGRPQLLHGIGQSPAVLATVAGRLLGIPSVVSLIGGELTNMPSVDYGELRTLKAEAFMQIPLRYADSITVASHFMKKRVESHGARANVLPFGIDTGTFTGPVTRPDGPPFRLLHVGTSCPIKDQSSIVRATRLLVDGGLDVELDVVGADEWDGSVQRQCVQLELTGRVRFHGWRAREELLSLYRRAHVFVMASLDDVAPVAVLEAAACGVPSVGTDVGFIADWAPEMAVKTAIGDPGALARGLEAVLSDPGYRQELGRRAQAWVRENASLEANDAFIALYRKLVNEREKLRRSTRDVRGS